MSYKEIFERNNMIKCQRCKVNNISFYCQSCPKPFDKLCQECDTYVHSIIPFKRQHERFKIGLFSQNNMEILSVDNSPYLNRINKLGEMTNNNYIPPSQNKIISISNNNNQKTINNNIKGTEEIKYYLNCYQERINELELENYKLKQTINNLSSENLTFRENHNKTIEKNIILEKEKEILLEKIKILREEVEKYAKENIEFKTDIDNKVKIIDKLDTNLKSVSNKLEKKECECSEANIYFNNKTKEMNDEKHYLLSLINDSNIKANNNDMKTLKYKEEIEFLKNRLVDLEQENVNSLKTISQLQRENKELIHRLNNLKKSLN